MIILSSQLVLNFLFIAASICAYMLGKLLAEKSNDEIVESTINFLVAKNLVRWKRDRDGEIELLPVDED